MTNRSYAYTRLQNYSSDFSATPKNGNTKKLQHLREKKGVPNSSSSEEDAEYSPTKLRRNKYDISNTHLQQPQRDFVDHNVQPGETLQGIALQYRCSVFDLKLANNIVNDVEFFAFRVLKVPVLLHSSLLEPAPVTSVEREAKLSPSEIRNSLTVRTDFLQQVDLDLQKLKEKAKTYEIQTDLAPSEEVIRSVQPKKMDCRGDDCGLSWTQLVGLAFLVLLACPLLYFLHLELEKHGNNTDNGSTIASNNSLPS